MKKIIYIGLVLCLPLFALMLLTPPKSRADLTFVTDTLSTSRLSVAARILSISGNLVSIDPTAATGFNSTSSANLRGQDAITINGVAHVVNAVEITNSNQFTTVAAAPAGAAGQSIYYRSQPVHHISFRTSTSVPDGFFRILIPASGTSNNNDTNPDPDGFDFNTITNANASAAATTNFNWVTAYEGATVSGGTNCTAGYHCFEFHYTGTGPSGSDIHLYIGDTTKSLIAPAPASGHNLGVADTYPVLVQQFPGNVNPSTYTPIDANKGRIALIESVRVTATVDPSISFQIIGMTSGITACGVTTTVNTQTAPNAPLSVPFGTLSLNTFATAAHTLIVSTNALNGYIVTAIENDQMGKDAGTTPFIPDNTCDAGTCTVTTAGNWVTPAGNAGFGYSLEAVSGATVEFTAGASFNSKPFANAAGLQPPTRIMYSTGVSNDHRANVCYRVSVDATQAAGDYENMVTYTATASF